MTDYTGTANLEAMTEAANYNAFLLKLAKTFIQDARQILDFGAGIGTFALRMREAGIDVECVEPDSMQAASLLRSQFTVYRDIDDTPSSAFECIYSFNVLEHIREDEQALRKIYDKLRPGGRLLVYVPAFQFLYSSMDRKVGHVRRYSKRDIVERLGRAGFVVQHASYCDSLGFFASMVYKWFGNSTGYINISALVAYDRFVFPLSRVLDVLLGQLFGKNVLALAYKE